MKVFYLFVLVYPVCSLKKSAESDEIADDPRSMAFYKFLYKRMKQNAEHEAHSKKAATVPSPFLIPGPFEPLPGRSHFSDYWPLFPFSNQYSGGIDLDPSISRHIGGDLNIPVPSWGVLDISGRFFNRIRDTVTKFGYISQPVNMLGLTKDDFIRIMTSAPLAFNRNSQPLLPIGKVPRSMVPLSCRPPMCNPYTQSFAFGMDHDLGGRDGAEGDINIPIPIGKDLAYRFPLGGNIYFAPDNITVTYGHHQSPVDPYLNPLMFANQDFINAFQNIDLLPNRVKRSIPYAPVEHYQMTRPMMRMPVQIPLEQVIPGGRVITVTFIVRAPVFTMKVISLFAVFCSVYCASRSRRVLKESDDDSEKAYYNFLNDLLREEAEEAMGGKDKSKKIPATHYTIPGPQEPLPGRSHNGDYWPVYPFGNSYSAGLEMDPAIGRRVGGNLNVAIPTWGMFDFSAKYFDRTRETVSKVGYVSHPVNMLGLDKGDFVELMSNPSLAYNRNFHPLLPLAKLPRSTVPLSCRPPLCNPYTQTFGMGVEHDIGGVDGFNGDIDLPVPIGKQLAYRIPLGGNIYFARDNITMNYGHNAAPVDPYLNPFMMGNRAFINSFQGIDDLSRLGNRRRRSVDMAMGYPMQQLQMLPVQYDMPTQYVYRSPIINPGIAYRLRRRRSPNHRYYYLFY